MKENGYDSSLWHPFADMATVRNNELVIDRADEVWIWDSEGKRYLDAFAGLWYVNVGHGRRQIIDAIHEQLKRLDAYTVFFDFANKPARDVAEHLAELAPIDDAKVFLGSGGGDGIETAAKIARRFFRESGRPERTHILSRGNAYHGTHGIGTSIAGIDPNRTGWGELVRETALVSHDSVEQVQSEIERIGGDRIAAFFCEPVIGAGGVIPPPPGYIEGVAELCRKHGILFVCDAVICGFGRLGTWFGIERWNVVPDMIVFAKGVTSGYLPLGGTIVSGRVAEPFFSEPGGPVLRHGPTWSGHPACCAAALANLEVIAVEGLLERGLEVERLLDRALAPLAEHDAVAEVRSSTTGAMAALDLVDGRARDVVGSMRADGVVARALNDHTLAVCPPLTVESEHVDLIREALDNGLAKLG